MTKHGAISAAAAYLLWGFFPIYFKLVQAASPLEILAHRVIWSLLFLALVLAITRDWRWLPDALRNRHALTIYLGAALLLGANWFTYIWAVNHDAIIESSLGYFINPLVSVLLGVTLLRERLRPGQWIPVGIAAMGVIYLTYRYGRLPWIALALALTFGLYGLLKKISPLKSNHGLTLETGFLFIPAILYLLALNSQGNLAFAHRGWTLSLLLALSGAITSIPLILFTAGAQAVPLYLLGMLQYTAPTLQFLLGVLVYHEPFTLDKLLGFALVWIALLLYTLEGYLNWQRNKPRQGLEATIPVLPE